MTLSVNKIILYFVVFLIYNLPLFCQENFLKEEKELQNVINSGVHDTIKVNNLIKLGNLYLMQKDDRSKNIMEKAYELSVKNNFQSGIIDSYNITGDYYYENGEYYAALKQYRSALQTSKKNNNLLKTAESYTNIGNVYFDMGKYNLAEEYYLKSKTIHEELKNNSGVALYYFNTANIFKDQGKFKESLENYLVSLKLCDEKKDKNQISKCYSNIGIIYAMQNMFSQALDYLEKALKIKEEINEIKGIYGNLSNIGNIYYLQGNIEKAIEYYMRSKVMIEQTGNQREISSCYNNLGNIYSDQNNYLKALDFFLKSLAIDEELEDMKGVAIVTQNIANTYLKLKDYPKALSYVNRSNDLSIKIGSPDEIRTNYRILADIFEGMNNFKEAFKYHKLYSTYNDSLFNSENSRMIEEMESKYQNEKKQKEIELQKSEITRHKTQKTAFIIGFLLVFILLVVVFYSFQQKRKANRMLAEQKHEIEEKNEELNQQNEEIAAQRDEIESQRDKISIINENVTESIKYAEKIQNAVMPSDDLIKIFFTPTVSQKITIKEHFIFYKPKDIVSGDFYWFAKKENMLLCAVGDCTGHGVPGAFMSMLGISYLNEIVSRKEIQTSAEVLNHLRKHIIQSLHQNNAINNNSEVLQTIKDGMDIAFIAVDTEKKEMQFAGANNPLWIIKPNNKEINKENTIQVIPADKKPIGISENMTPFTNNFISIENDDIIYLFSDGFKSQFGGPSANGRGKKFLDKNFKQLIADNCNHPLKQQKDILEQCLNDWKNSYGISHEQTDDITVIGLKIESIS